ncbi:Ku DNA-binding complex, Ku70 subunit [Lichtheimia hyalospora FSU 10163]|nr:Ku DNA-binding complex, Ku70 subunit [Lichtheimia hyalospora FSU 10163]
MSLSNPDPLSFDLNDDPTVSDELLTSYDNRDQILFVIDCGPDMNKPEPNGKVPIKVAFDCVKSVTMSKIFAGTSDRLGVVLFNTDKTNNPAGHEHIYILQDLDIPDAPRVKEAEMYSSEGKADIQKTFGSTNKEYPFGNVFWTCSDMFNAGNTTNRLGSRRVFLVTNQDNPHANQSNLRQAAIRRAKDFYDAGIRIELFGLDKGEHHFNESLFYNEILSQGEGADATQDEDVASQRVTGGVSNKLDELLDNVRRREPNKRTSFRVHFTIAPEIVIGVRGYNLIMQEKRSTPHKVTGAGERIEEVEAQITYKCQDTQQVLLSTEIKSAFDYGGSQVVFSQEEIKKMRSVKEKGITLLGFRRKEKQNDILNISHSYFIYPDETQYEGSNRTFTALLKAMLAKNKIGVCSFTPRDNANTTIALMYPQAETFDENGAQDRPPGIHIIPMPYADDIRDLPITNTPIATEEQVEMATKAIFGGKNGGMEIKKRYDPDLFEDPALQLHYATLESIALDKPMVDHIVDTTKPNVDMINQRIGQGLKELRERLAADVGVSEEDLRGQKRKVSDSQPESSSSRRRRDAPSKSIEDHYQEQTLDKCTVVMLKDWLDRNGVKPKRAKADIIAQVCDVLDKRQ